MSYKIKVGDIYVDVVFDAIDVDTIQLKTPVRTGNLRDNFRLDIDGDIINMAEYADEVELGTANSPGSFMVTRSLNEIGERLVKRVAKQMEDPKIIKLPDITIKVGK